MALTLPDNFKNDIQGKDTQLVPLVVIGNYLPYPIIEISDPNLWISTNSFTYTHAGENRPVQPLLLNIPSLKESIDLETRKYKISSISLDISNAPYEGRRFSEVVESIMNVQCSIFWTSPSTSHLPIAGNIETYSYFPIYYGIIRRYTHDTDKVRIVVEDRSESTFHKELPLEKNWLGDDESVPNKYKNKPIPMVYGEVDRSPCVVSNIANGDDTDVVFYSDSDSSVSFVEPTDKVGTLAFYDDGYTEVLSHISDDLSATDNLYVAGEQFTTNGNVLTLLPSRFKNTADEEYYSNINERVAYCSKTMFPTHMKMLNHDDSWNSENLFVYYGVDTNGIEITTITSGNVLNLIGNSSDYIGIDGHIQIFTDSNGFHERSNVIMPTMESLPADIETGAAIYLIGQFQITNTSYGTGVSYQNTKLGITMRISGAGLAARYINIYDTGGSNTYDYDQSRAISNYRDFHQDGISDSYKHILALGESLSPSFRIFPVRESGENDEADTWCDYTAAISKLGFVAKFWVKKIFDQNFYVNVKGRRELDGEAMVNSNYFANVPRFILDILNRELLGIEPYYEISSDGQIVVGDPPAHYYGMDANSDVYTYYGQGNTPEGYNWLHAFTVNKKINSKTLIEQLCSSSPVIARFDNMGNFKFNIIKKHYGVGDEQHTISENDVISFTFSRTRIEKVYTKVVFKYNWDYGREEFNSTEEVSTDVYFGEEFPAYYGLKEDHSESELLVDDERGKYIRDETTAEEFAEWLLFWHCNQHLKIKVKLPLKYMSVEIGDIIKFDAILGGVKPYGINYTSNTADVNGQPVYPYFMVTSTNKTLEYVEIETMQMHTLEHCPEGYDCNNVCGGTTEVDNCGVCGGQNQSCDECWEDFGFNCGGVPDMNTPYPHGCYNMPEGDCDCAGNQLDECGVCGGDGIPEGDCDCNDNVDLGCGCGQQPFACWNGSEVCYSNECDGAISPIGFSMTHYHSLEITTAGADTGSPMPDINLHLEKPDLRSTGYVIMDVKSTFDMYNLGLSDEVKVTQAKIKIEKVDNDPTQDGYNPANENVQLYCYDSGIDPTLPAYYFEYCDEAESQYYDAVHNGNTSEVTFFAEQEVVDQHFYRLFNIDPDTEAIEFSLKFSIIYKDSNSYEGVDGTEAEYVSEFLVNVVYDGCSQLGDMNADGGWNVLDVVDLGNCVLAHNCADLHYGCAGDMNGDGGYNVLDIVALVECIMNTNCGEI